MDDSQKTTNIDELLKELTKSSSSQPSASQSAPSPIAPSSSQVVPKPVVPPPRPAQPMPPSPKEYQSSIRTMAGDISNLKAGQKPVGIDVRKITELPSQKPALTPTPPPIPPKPTGPLPKISLGEMEKSGSMRTPVPTSPLPTKPSPAPTMPISPLPPKRKNNILLWTIILLILLAGAGLGYWYFDMSEPEVVIESPTPSETPTQTPEVKKLTEYFPTTRQTSMPTGHDPLKFFTDYTKSIPSVAGQFNRYDIIFSQKGASQSLSFESALQIFLLKYPNDLLQSLGSESVLLGYGQQEVFDKAGQKSILPNNNPTKLVLIAESAVPLQMANSIRSWEQTITADLNSLFGLQLPKDAQFMDNTYSGVAIRYINGPNPDTSIDYGIVSTANGKSYLVIAGSREAMYAAIDRLRTQ